MIILTVETSTEPVMITPMIVEKAISKPLDAYNANRRNVGCHLTIRNMSTHPLKSGLRLVSENASLINCDPKDSTDFIMPGSHLDTVVRTNGWKSASTKFKIFLTYHVMESSTEMSKKLATWFSHFLLPISIVNERKVSYFCGFTNAFPNIDLQDDKCNDRADQIFQYWKDQMLQLSRYAVQAQDESRFLECYAGDSKFAEIKIEFTCRCTKCLSKFHSHKSLYPLHEAVLDANASKIAHLLPNTDSPDSLDLRGRTPMHLAAKENFFDIAKLLLGQGANKNARDSDMNTPLTEAAFWGSLDVVKVLVNEFKNQPCDLRAAAIDGRTALHEAAFQNHAQIVKLLLDKDRTLVNTADSNGYTPLHLGCESGSLESVKMLLDHYADPRLLTSFGATALHMTCRGAHTDILDLLMHKCSAQQYARIQDAFGFEPMRYAVHTRSVPFVQALIDYGTELRYVSSKDKRTAIHDAAEMGDCQILKFLITKHRFSPDMADLFGNTPMHIAAYFGYVDVVKDLVSEYRANTSVLNHQGATAFFLASQQGNLDVVKYFLQVDAYLMRIPIADDNRLPIHYAIYNGHENVVAVMIEHGCDILSSNDARRKTVFDFAVQAGRSSIAEMLIKALKRK